MYAPSGNQFFLRGLWFVGAVGTRGNVQEVTAANVKDANVLFPKEALEKLDAMCGQQQGMRGMLVKEGTSATKEQKEGWKNFKCRPSQHK